MTAAEPLVGLRPLVLGDEDHPVRMPEQPSQLGAAVAAGQPVVDVEAYPRTVATQRFPLGEAGRRVVPLVDQHEVRSLGADDLDRGVVDVAEVRAQPSEPAPDDVLPNRLFVEPHGFVRHRQSASVLRHQSGRESDGGVATGSGMRFAEPLGHAQQGAPLGSLRHRHVHDARHYGLGHWPSSTIASRWMTSRSYCGPRSRARSWVVRPSMPGSSSDE